jgi:hypothetical protein
MNFPNEYSKRLNGGHLALMAGSSVSLPPDFSRQQATPKTENYDHHAIRSHVAMLHKLAKAAGVDGILTYTRIEGGGGAYTEQFAIGDADGMADSIIGRSGNHGVNVYLPWVIWRNDLPRGKKGSEADVRAVLALVGDLDADKGKAVSLDDLPLDAPYVVETSSGNCHATFPLKHALTAAEAKPIAIALSDAINGDSGTKDVSHLWRVPGTSNWPNKVKLERGRSPEPQKVRVKVAWSGETIEPARLLEIAKAAKPKDDKKDKGDDSHHTDRATKTFEDLQPEIQKMIASPPFPGEDRSATAMSVFAKLWHRGWSQAEIKAVVERYPQGFVGRYANEAILEKDVARCFEKFEAEGDRDANEAEPADDLPIVTVKPGRLSKLATRAEELLIAATVPIYRRSDNLVRPIIETADASRGRKTKVAALKTIETVYLRDLLGRHGAWVKEERVGKKKTSRPIDPPTAVAATILARVGEWTFPAIAGVITTPTMRPDGSLLTEQGYDDETRLLLVEPPSMPPIPELPTRQDAEAALKLIEDLLVGFPFVDDVARAVALSGIITPVVRGAFPVSPLHASRAPTAGSGKSFLWDVVAAIAIGQLMPVMSTGASTEEMEKRLGSALMKCQPLISVDNISGELGGDALCQAIERPVVDIRILGRSENVRVEAKGTTLFATGNNFIIVGDVCRRVIIANLDPQLEQPELRQFEFDPVLTVLKERGKYIAAALTICRAHIVAGRPDLAPKLASFEGWSDTVRSALMWLGKVDPVKSMEASRAEDPERLELINMMDAWSDTIGVGADKRMKLAGVLLKGSATVTEREGGKQEPENPELHAALEDICFRCTGRRNQPDARMLGNWLRRFRGRVIDKKRFAYRSNEKGGSEWWLETI